MPPIVKPFIWQKQYQEALDFKSTFNFYVVNQLRQLGMVDAKFEASFSDVDGLVPQGVDSIEFKLAQIQICHLIH